jgi:Ca2+-binding RTX toxin-like protein
MPDNSAPPPPSSIAALYAAYARYQANFVAWYGLPITISDTPGNDTVYGTEGAERISGNSGDDVIYGFGGNDYLEGGNEYDQLYGGEGDDFLDAGRNHDDVYGGPGDDYYLIYGDEAAAQDTLHENSGEGFDWVRSSQNGYTLPDNIEGMLLHIDGGGGMAYDGNGNGLDNVIVGQELNNHIRGLGGDDLLVGMGGSDMLEGGDGADWLDGGAGNDRLDGGSGFDAAVYAGMSAGYQITRGGNPGDWTVTDLDLADGNDGTDTLTGIEQLRFADTVTGQRPAVSDLFLGLLTLDAYSRGHAPALLGRFDPASGTVAPLGDALGDAVLLFDTGGDAPSALIGFDAAAWRISGGAGDSYNVIAYRGTDDALDPAYGWPLGGGDIASPQAVAALNFYDNLLDAGLGSVETVFTGHSLGGGLAGYVAGINSLSAAVFDSMAFQAGAIIYAAAHLGTPNFDRINGYEVTGQILNANMLLASGVPIAQLNSGAPQAGSVQLHSQALLMLLLFGEQLGPAAYRDAANRNTISAVLFNALYDDTLAQAVTGITTITAGSGYAGIMRSIIAYSLLDHGARPFGDTAIRALFDDFGDLGLAATSAPWLNGNDALKQAISNLAVEYSAVLAINAVMSAAEPMALGGILDLTAGNSLLTVDLSSARWGPTSRYGAQIGQAQLAEALGFPGTAYDFAGIALGSADTILTRLAADHPGAIGTLFSGGEGDDTVQADCGNNYVDLGNGTNSAMLGAGLDIVRGGSGTDTVDVGAGGGRIESGGGADVITSGRGQFDQRILAGSGNDQVTVRGGDTLALGGDDFDTLIVDLNWSQTAVTGSAAAGMLTDIDYIGPYGAFSNSLLDPEFARIRFAQFERLVIFTGAGNDVVTLGEGNDTVSTGGGNDRIDPGGGLDQIDGGIGSDTMAISVSGAVADIVSIEAIEFANGAVLTLTGNQFSSGLAFNTLFSGSGGLVVTMTAGTALFAAQMDLSSSVTLTVTGTSEADVVKGALSGVNLINGGGGIDQIRGGILVDTINGGDGNDKIMGLGGADVLTGGTGADQFRYLFANDSVLGANADRILDFTNGEDRLDFRTLDADPIASGRQTVTFIGTAAFSATGAAQVRYADSGADTLVLIDLNGDGTADMQITLAGHAGQALAGTDFLF